MQLRLASWACAFGLGILATTTTARAAISREIAPLPAARHNFAPVRVTDGRVLLMGGFQVVDRQSTATKTVLAFVPETQTWEVAGQLLQPHIRAVPTLLPDGRVLLLAENGSEIFDPDTGTSSPVPPIDFVPERSATVLLDDGRVLSVGGTLAMELRSRIFDPQTGVWTHVPLAESFSESKVTVVRLLDGRVMIVGGLREGDQFVPTVEIFDPKTNVWATASQPMNAARQDPTAVVLRDGRVLVSGGVDAADLNEIDHAEMYDPATETWSVLSATPFKPRYDADGFLLPDGRVAIVGGFKRPLNSQWPVEIFDPRSMKVEVLGELGAKRDVPEFQLLADGRILACGGISGESDDLGRTAELIDPRAQAWIQGDSLFTPRGSHAAARLENGSVLVLGGTDTLGVQVASAELFDPATSSWRVLKASMSVARAAMRITPIDSRRLLVTGGEAGDNSNSAAEIFDAVTEEFLVVENMHFDRSKHASERLADGRVLITGGSDSGGNELADAEIFDPTTQTFSLTTSMNNERSAHGMNVLDDGRVLVTGGYPTIGAELFDPQTEQWTDLVVPWETRRNHISIKLHDGRVLLAGGETLEDNALADAWIFDPHTNQWRAVPNMHESRAAAAAALLPDGRVFVLGGIVGISALDTAEVFNPNNETWTTMPSMSIGRIHPTATSLLDGRVLVTGGGQDAIDGAKSVEIFGRSVGTACETGDECAQGVCVDGVCCSEECIDSTVCRVCSIRWGATDDGVCKTSALACTEYACDPTIGKPKCKDSCLSAADCGTGYVCSLSGRCVLPENFFVRDGCVAARGDTGGESVWGGVLAVGGLIIWRRRRRNRGFRKVAERRAKSS